MIMLLALAALAIPQIAIAEPERPAITKKQVAFAAKQCGTKVKFVDMPSGLRTMVPARFGYNLDPSTTEAQRTCFYNLVPTTKVGFISEPPPLGKKK